jgi:hypothetical protein
MKKVILTVEPTGKSTIQAEGYEGGTCLDATAAFEALFTKTERERQMVGECGPRKDDGERVKI